MQHVLPSPLPDVGKPGHPMPHDTVGRHDLPTDIGTGPASFALACVALAITLAMGVLALSHLADHVSVLAHNAERATAMPEATQGGRLVVTPTAWATPRQ